MTKPYTKNLIKSEFLKLLEDYPFRCITISQLTQECDINRNTFYYHYEDIYSLVKEILQDELDKVDQEFNTSFSWEESLLHAAAFLLDNKKAAQNLFQSIDKKESDAYLSTVCMTVMNKYVENECHAKDIQAQESDKQLITDFYQAALVGLLTQWVQDGMTEAPQAIIFRIGQLFDGNIERSLRISQDLPSPPLK